MSEDRDAFFDNARFLLMAAVVFGHAIEPLTGQSRALAATYTWLYAFHMPLFVFIAGHFAHASLRIRPLFTRLLLPYVLLQFAYTWFGHVVHKTPEWSLHLLTPDWILWFLLSLLWWRLFLPLWLRLPQPFAGQLRHESSASPNKHREQQPPQAPPRQSFIVHAVFLSRHAWRAPA